MNFYYMQDTSTPVDPQRNLELKNPQAACKLSTLEAVAFIFPSPIKDEESPKPKERKPLGFDLDKAIVATGPSHLHCILHLCSGGQANLYI